MDLISRQLAIDAVKGEIEINGYSKIIDVLQNLPTVTPKAEQRWIPCYPSELPKDMILWVTFQDEYGCRYVETVFWDMTEWSTDVTNAVAYMPYEEPQPYKRD